MKTNDIKTYSCFKAHKLMEKSCKNKKCRYWHNINEANNCIINKSNGIPHSLQDIGDLFNITRMRVCQIEKKVIKKIKKNI